MINLTKIKNAQKYFESPFIKEAVFRIDPKRKTVIIGKGDQLIVDASTSEVNGIGLFHQFKMVDKEQFTKIYTSEVGALFNLSKSGLRVFGYLLKAMRMNRDSVYLDAAEIARECGYKSDYQAVRGLIELTNNSIIAKSNKPKVWWINPNVIFNGDRIAFIKQYKIKQDTAIVSSELPNNDI